MWLECFIYIFWSGNVRFLSLSLQKGSFRSVWVVRPFRFSAIQLASFCVATLKVPLNRTSGHCSMFSLLVINSIRLFSVCLDRFDEQCSLYRGVCRRLNRMYGVRWWRYTNISSTKGWSAIKRFKYILICTPCIYQWMRAFRFEKKKINNKKVVKINKRCYLLVFLCKRKLIKKEKIMLWLEFGKQLLIACVLVPIGEKRMKSRVKWNAWSKTKGCLRLEFE